MGLFNRKNDTQTANVVRSVGDFLGFLSWGGSGTKKLNNTTALESAAVMCAVKVIAEALASMPISVVETSEVDGRERTKKLRTHWATRLLSKKPNSWQTSYEFIEGMAINAILGSGALAIKVKVGNEVRELIPVPAGAWVQEQLSDSRAQYRVTYSNGNQQIFSQDQVLFVRGISLDGYSGLRAIESARKAIGISMTLEEQQEKLGSSGGKPSGVLSFENELKEETKRQLAESWSAKFGPNGTGGIAILDGKASFNSFTMSNTDSQFIENRKFQIEEIARAFKVPAQMLMLAGSSGFSNSDDTFRHFTKFTLLPWVRRFEDALNRDLLDNADDLYIDMDERALLRGDIITQSNYWGKALGGGGIPAVMTVNEVRAEAGFDAYPEEWADQLSKGGYAAVSGFGENDEKEQDPQNDN